MPFVEMSEYESTRYNHSLLTRATGVIMTNVSGCFENEQTFILTTMKMLITYILFSVSYGLLTMKQTYVTVYNA